MTPRQTTFQNLLKIPRSSAAIIALAMMISTTIGNWDKKPKIYDIKSSANFRAGYCLSPTMVVGDLDTKLLWKCSFNHEFYASPRLVLKAGHWCQKCAAPPWNDEEIAKQNPFFAQVME